MRLTVHVTDAKKETITKRTANGEKTIKRTMNTLSFSDVTEDDVDRILAQIKDEELGTPTKYYLSGERIRGHARVKKKN